MPSCQMWEIREQFSDPDNYICRNQLQLLTDRVICPRETEEQICSQILEKCEKSEVVVVGDFNFPLIDWESVRARGSDGEQFISCVQKGFLRQYVDNPTREEDNLDLVRGNEPGQ
eukprot:g24253.t1